MDKVNQKMRKFNLRGVLIGLRATALGNSPHKLDSSGIEETLRSEHFQVAKVRHSARSPLCRLATSLCRDVLYTVFLANYSDYYPAFKRYRDPSVCLSQGAVAYRRAAALGAKLP